MIYDIKDTPITVYRLLDEGRVIGYTLDPLCKGPKEKAFELSERDIVRQIQVHLFQSLREAWAFREGLIMAGDPEPEMSGQPCGWAVLRLLAWPPEDPDDPAIKVIDCTDRQY